MRASAAARLLFLPALRGEAGEAGARGEITVLAGIYDGPLEARPEPVADPLVLFAGRHIPEKRVPAIVPAIARARARVPAMPSGDRGRWARAPGGVAPRPRVRRRGAVEVPGFVATETVDELMGRALCMLLPSRREGYGLVVIEAAARGTPSIVVPDPDNAAVELIEDGVNGVIARSVSPEDLAAAILRVNEAGVPLRHSTADWFTANAHRLSLERRSIGVRSYSDRAVPRTATSVQATDASLRCASAGPSPARCGMGYQLDVSSEPVEARDPRKARFAAQSGPASARGGGAGQRQGSMFISRASSTTNPWRPNSSRAEFTS